MKATINTMKIIDRIVFSLAFLLLFACKQKDMVSQSVFQEFGSEGMVPLKEYVFLPFDSLVSSSSDSVFDISIAVRYSDRCRLRDLPLNVETVSFSADTIFFSNISVPLFDAEDSLEGKGNFGIYEQTYPLLKHQKPDERLSIAVSSHEKLLEGILALGVIIEKHSDK